MMLMIGVECVQEKEHKDEVHDLFDPNSTSKVVGKITLGYSAEVSNLPHFNLCSYVGFVGSRSSYLGCTSQRENQIQILNANSIFVKMAEFLKIGWRSKRLISMPVLDFRAQGFNWSGLKTHLNLESN